MSKHRVTVMALTIILAGLSGSARGDFTVASNIQGGYTLSGFDNGVGFAGSNSNGVWTNEAASQEFQAGASGMLTTLVATLDQFQPQGVSLKVSITTALEAMPGTLLGSMLFATGQESSNIVNGPSTWDLSSLGINFNAGQFYFVTFTVATPIAGSVRYRAVLVNTNSQSFGLASLDSRDEGATWDTPVIPNEIGITVSARAVPEPSTLVLTSLGLIALGLGLVSRRRLRATA
jgi:hypothetical protein